MKHKTHMWGEPIKHGWKALHFYILKHDQHLAIHIKQYNFYPGNDLLSWRWVFSIICDFKQQ